MGILIVQDVLLGVLMALLPNMADTGIQKDTNYNLYFMIGFRLICGKDLAIKYTRLNILLSFYKLLLSHCGAG